MATSLSGPGGRLFIYVSTKGTSGMCHSHGWLCPRVQAWGESLSMNEDSVAIISRHSHFSCPSVAFSLRSVCGASPYPWFMERLHASTSVEPPGVLALPRESSPGIEFRWWIMHRSWTIHCQFLPSTILRCLIESAHLHRQLCDTISCRVCVVMCRDIGPLPRFLVFFFSLLLWLFWWMVYGVFHPIESLSVCWSSDFDLIAGAWCTMAENCITSSLEKETLGRRR